MDPEFWKYLKYALAQALAFFAVFILCVPSYAQYPGFDAPSSANAGGGAISGGISPVQPKVDGGNIPLGATSQIVILFRNDGGQPIETGKINLYPSSTVSASVSLDQCGGEPIPAGAECAVAVSVKGLQAGPWRLELLMLHSGRSRLTTATLSGIIDPSADATDKLSSDIETIPNQVEFGALGASQMMVEPVILRNVTSTKILISDVFINASGQSGYSVETDCKELEAGQACIATVTWSPKQKGPSTGVLVVKHSGPTAVASVSLSGDYTPDAIEQAQLFPEAVPGKGLLVSSQKEINYGESVKTASTITVSLVNTGDAALTLKDIKISGSDNGLSFSGNGCISGLKLEPIEACPLTLTWSPTRLGGLLDDIQIIHDGARGVLVLPVRGTSETVVSQDQKAIVLSQQTQSASVVGETDIAKSEKRVERAAQSSQNNSTSNPASALDGLKITSFSSTRAIISGPGGSRLVFNNEDIMLGGVLWHVDIQKNGIEFISGASRVLLLFDRSLSSVNRISGKSRDGNADIAQNDMASKSALETK